MIHKPEAKSLRAASGMERMRRFASQGGEIHAADGFFGNLRKAVMPTDAEKAAKQQYIDSTRAPAPVESAPAPKAISGYAGNTALEGRMKAAGLRNGGDLRTGRGGHVPGSGSGDKIPAKYEPGEFVVSNDMLDAQPELRSHLRGLRENVLAEKGMTPEQADAKAMTGGGLRAANGAGPEAFKRIAGALAQPAAATPQVTGISQSAESLLRSPAQPFVNPAANPITPDMVEAHGNGRYGAPANPSAAVPAAPAAPAAPQSLAQRSMGTLRSAGNAVKSVGPAIVAGVAGSAAAKYARGVGAPVAGPRDPDGNHDGVAAGIPTDGYPAAPAAQPYNYFTDNETGRNIGNTLNALPGAVSPFRAASALNGLRGVGATAANMGVAATLGASADIQDGRQATSAAPQTATQPGQQNTLQDAPAGATGPQPSANSVRVERQANGNMAFSGENISGTPNYIGPASGSLRGGANPVNVMPGMSQEVIDHTLNNPDGSRWSATDNARMAANLRDGVDQYSGTSRQPAGGGADKYAGLSHKTAAALRVADAQANVSRENNAASNAAAMYGHKLTYQTALRSAQRAQSNSDRDYGLAKETHDQKVGVESRARLLDEMQVIGADGKPDLAAGQQKANFARQIFTGIDSMTEDKRNEAMSTVKELLPIFEKAKGQDNVGMDYFKNFFDPKRPELRSLPNAKGGSTEQVGMIGGLFTIGASNGDTLLKQKDGRTLSLGKLNQKQTDELDNALKNGWMK